MNLGLLLIGLAAALWVVYDAKTKWKYSTGKALMWAAGTLLVVYIVLPLYFFIGRKMQGTGEAVSYGENQEEVYDEEANMTKKCPMCAAKLAEDILRCPYCGYTLDLHCEYCGQELQRDWDVCPNCGEDTPEK